jgi:hypothetical protein
MIKISINITKYLPIRMPIFEQTVIFKEKQGALNINEVKMGGCASGNNKFGMKMLFDSNIVPPIE